MSTKHLSAKETAKVIVAMLKRQSSRYGRLRLTRNQICHASGRERLAGSIEKDISSELQGLGCCMIEGTCSFYLFIDVTVASSTWKQGSVRRS
jgi:hypothetical protein